MEPKGLEPSTSWLQTRRRNQRFALSTTLFHVKQAAPTDLLLGRVVGIATAVPASKWAQSEEVKA